MSYMVRRVSVPSLRDHSFLRIRLFQWQVPSCFCISRASIPLRRFCEGTEKNRPDHFGRGGMYGSRFSFKPFRITIFENFDKFLIGEFQVTI